MENIPDEDLMAFADGALPATEHARIEALLTSDLNLRDRLQPFVVSRAVLAEAFSEPMHLQIPDRLIKTVLNSPISPASATRLPAKSRPIARLVDGLNDLLFSVGPQFGYAFAVSALLATGAGLGWFAAHRSMTPGGFVQTASLTGEIVADPALARVLETGPSGAAALADGQISIKPVLTFQSQDGKFCREYDLATEAGKHLSGFACRQSGGAWHVVFQAESKAAASGYETAGGASPALEAAIEKFSDGGRIEAADEAALIAKGWGAPPH